MRSSVLLPDPFGPVTTQTWPASTCAHTSEKTLRAPKRCPTPSQATEASLWSSLCTLSELYHLPGPLAEVFPAWRAGIVPCATLAFLMSLCYTLAQLHHAQPRRVGRRPLFCLIGSTGRYRRL